MPKSHQESIKSTAVGCGLSIPLSDAELSSDDETTLPSSDQTATGNMPAAAETQDLSESFGETLKRKKSISSKRTRERARNATVVVAKIAVLTALATVLLLLEFPIFPAVRIYQLNFSDVPALIGTFMCGPLAGAIISTLRVLFFYHFRGTSSAFVGEISNIVGGLALVIPTGLIYGKKHSLKRAILGTGIGALAQTVIMFFFNLYIFIPMFAPEFMPQLIPFEPRLLFTLSWCLPFNIIRGVVNASLTIILYKGTEKIIIASSKSRKRKKTEPQTDLLNQNTD